MTRIYAYITCTRVKWEATVAEYAGMTGKTEAEVRAEWEDDSDYDADTDIIRLEDPMEEHGWIDRRWSATQLYDNRNYVNPVVSEVLDNAYALFEEVRDALEWLPGGYRDRGDGTFHSSESSEPFDDPWRYDYALHFVEKFLGPKDWTERPWTGVQDCLKNAGHNIYPHTPGTLYDCQACEEECFCEDGFTCVSCAEQEESH